jgi:hypothetical protein
MNKGLIKIVLSVGFLCSITYFRTLQSNYLPQTEKDTASSTCIKGNEKNSISTVHYRHPTTLLSMQLSTTPPRDQIGTWVGKWWIPPPEWKLFSPIEMVHMYSNRSVLWLGDSTARRPGMTMYGILANAVLNSLDYILESDLDKEININKDRVTEECTKFGPAIDQTICREMPHSHGQHDFIYKPAYCLTSVRDFFRNEMQHATNCTILYISHAE